MRRALCVEVDPTYGVHCHKEAGHDDGQHYGYDADGHDVTWLKITVPPKED